MSTRFDMAAILFLEVVIFSDKEKSVFQLWWKNTSSHKKIYKTKKFYIIELHMEWSKIFNLRPKPKMLQPKIWFFEKCKKIKICQNLNFTFFRTIIAQGLKMTNEGYFSFYMGANK